MVSRLEELEDLPLSRPDRSFLQLPFKLDDLIKSSGIVMIKNYILDDLIISRPE